MIQNKSQSTLIPFSADYLPDEIIFMILTKLPVKLLLRFRCVCKTWDSIIRSRAFILNYTFSKSQISYYVHILERQNKCFKPMSRAMLCDSSFSVISKVDTHSTFSSLCHSPLVVGSCNGLLCLVDISRLAGEVYLWNPSIRKYKILPSCCNFSEKSYHEFSESKDSIVVGLGFDSKTNDYKIVRMSFFEKPQAEVYSLRLDSWGRVGLSDHLMKNLIGTHSWDYAYVDGAVHWLAKFLNEEGKPYTSILKFDVSEERFDEVKIPDYMISVNCSRQELTVFKGVLALFVGGYDPTRQSSSWVCSLWTMNNSIWTKQRVDFERIGARCECIGDHLIVEDLYDGKLYLFDPQTLEAKALEILQFTSIHAFTEGLALL